MKTFIENLFLFHLPSSTKKRRYSYPVLNFYPRRIQLSRNSSEYTISLSFQNILLSVHNLEKLLNGLLSILIHRHSAHYIYPCAYANFSLGVGCRQMIDSWLKIGSKVILENLDYINTWQLQVFCQSETSKNS